MLGDLSGKYFRRIIQKNGLIVVLVAIVVTLINGLIRMDFNTSSGEQNSWIYFV